MSIVLTERTYDQFSITMCYYQNRIFKTLAAWLFVNLVLPMFLPAIILYAYSISQGGSDGFCTIFIKLMKCGMYVFSSFTLTFSLFEDYEKARQVVTPIHYLLILVMLIFLNKEGVGFHVTLLMTVVPFLPALMLFCLGISFILSTIYIRFRDISHIYSVVLTLWMYLTPLFYSLDIINGHERAKMILKLNPMYHYVTYFRELLMGQVPSLVSHGIIYAWGIGMCAIGFVIFHFSKKKFLLYI